MCQNRIVNIPWIHRSAGIHILDDFVREFESRSQDNIVHFTECYGILAYLLCDINVKQSKQLQYQQRCSAFFLDKKKAKLFWQRRELREILEICRHGRTQMQEYVRSLDRSTLEVRIGTHGFSCRGFEIGPGGQQAG